MVEAMSILMKYFRARAFAIVGSMMLFGPALAQDQVPGDLPSEPLDAREEAVRGVQPEPPAIVVPRILSEEDALLYIEIFRLQEDGNWRQADKLRKQIDNDILMGHVLFQRYMHPTKYRSRYTELRDWMGKYADQPEAGRVYRLAMRRKPAKARAPRSPTPLHYKSRQKPVKGAAAPKRLTREDRARRKEEYSIRSKISYNLRRGRAEQAEKRLWAAENTGLFDELAFDTQMSRIAAGYYYSGENEKALALGSIAASRSGGELPEAAWIAGLGAWRIGDYKLAATLFEAATGGTDTTGWLVSAGAYWAARAYLKSHEPDKVLAMLKLAAQNSRTFYGFIASRQLGNDLDFDWSPPALQADDLAEVAANPGIARAIALTEIGHVNKADREYRWTSRRAPPAARKALMRLAVTLDLPASQIRLSQEQARSGGDLVDAALYPVPNWLPSDGLKLDRALLYAVMRQESNFMQHAKSHAGARGVMQLMPGTASFIARDRSLRGSKRKRLFDPEFNMSLGQKYLIYLLEKETTDKNLFLVAIAYNAGPGNLAKWLRNIDHGDDWLLFIESLTSRETRNYVERVMANLWAYRSRLGQETPTLDAVAKGFWAHYTSLEGFPVAGSAAGK
jgi:soluble lytic murein transglycosylase